MTNEDIVSNEPSFEIVGYSRAAVIRLMALARADELRKVATRLEEMSTKPVPKVREFDCDLMRITANRLRREAGA